MFKSYSLLAFHSAEKVQAVWSCGLVRIPALDLRKELLTTPSEHLIPLSLQVVWMLSHTVRALQVVAPLEMASASASAMCGSLTCVAESFTR